jgi:hypothetical protein
MAPNREGPVVPWVNVLDVRGEDGRHVAALFEHPAHPVVVPDESRLTSADFPGAAVARIHEALGEEVVPLFGQGCCGNINGYPLRTTHENADAAGRKLGDAVLGAMDGSVRVKADRLGVREAVGVELPTRELPSMQVWQEAHDRLSAELRRGPDKWRSSRELDTLMQRLNALRGMIERGEKPPPRRLDATAVMLGREWILVALSHDTFCEYELWIDENAPFERTMALGHTNGGQGYIPVDEALALGDRGGYEAGSLPAWGAAGALSEFFGPPAIGVESIVKRTVAGLWEGSRT